MSEAENPPAKSGKHVQIGRLGGQRKRKRGKRRLAVEPGAAHARAEQEMGDRFQAGRRILSCELRMRQSPLIYA